jgi:hypothetical protein
MLDKKLQLKDGQTLAVLYSPITLDTQAKPTTAGEGDAVLVFISNKADLLARLTDLQAPAALGKLTWVAYPKSKQLGTDLNRDILRNALNSHGLDPVRQIAIDDTWSALRLKTVQTKQ